MKKILNIFLIYIFFNTTGLACSMIPERRSLETIDSKDIHITLEFNRITKKCTIQSSRKSGDTYYNKYWIFNTTTLFSANGITTYPEVKHHSDQQEILSQHHSVNELYDIKNEKVLLDFENIKNRFSKENLDYCMQRTINFPN